MKRNISKHKIFFYLFIFLAWIFIFIFCFFINFDNKVTKTYSNDLNGIRIEVAKPHDLKDVIVLDAGHGYCDGGGGCKLNNVFEYIPNAQLIYKIANMLADTGFFEVYITHPLNYAGENLKFDPSNNPNHRFIHVILPEIKPDSGDKKLVGMKNYSTTYSANFVKNVMNSVVDSLKKTRSKIYSLSIHHNCAGSQVETTQNNKVIVPAGMRTFYCSNKNYTAFHEDSVKFCNNLLKYCSNLYGSSTSNFLIRSEAFFVTQVNCPAVLCEIDFIDNLQRQKLILNDRHQNRMARGIKNAIMDLYGYDVKWAKVSVEKKDVDDYCKLVINVKNLPQNIKKLKLAVYGAVNNDEKPIWCDADSNSNGIWICELKIQKNCSGKLNIDVYGEINDKLTFLDSDFDEFELK